MSDVRLNAGYAPIYAERGETLLLAHDFHAFHVLYVLAYHADEMGICNPGLRRIRDLCGCSDDAVVNALMRLQQREWVGEHHTINKLRRKTEVDYQIRPDVIYIRLENIQEAWSLWANCTIRDIGLDIEQSENTFIPWNNQIQPDSTTTLGPAPEPPPPPPPEPLQKTLEPKRKKPKDKGEEQNPPRAAHPTTPQGAKNPPPGSARPPSLKRSDFSRALTNAAQEHLAREVKEIAPTRLAQARELVYRHDETLVQAGLKLLRKTHNVRNPFGLLTFWLTSGGLSPDDAASPFDSDLIER